MDEQYAIQRLKAGEIRGLEYLVFQHQVKAVRVAFLITQDVQMAEDIVQDAYLKVHRSILHFDETRAFAPWFLRIVINDAIKAARRQSRQVAMDDESAQKMVAGLRTDLGTVDAQVEMVEFQSHVWESLQSLSPRQRAVVVQRYYLEMSEKEMVATLAAPPGTVKWLLNAARRNLRSLLGKEVEK